MRLIDADALMKKAKALANQKYKSGVLDLTVDDVSESFMNASGVLSTEWWCVEDMIENAQTIDAVEVVRCRDCKFYDRNFEYCHNVVFGDGHANYSPPCVNDDDYCSFGVRREDGEVR